eukprot:CAMPEP_0197622040 /NCGR_PEP_ID=MMETSP1338-20131121/2435_1 /TAXON_ID=43686 ORGANISM="Pelagodinium beii, Strain RCC1491" /NCGR_SAMPLE_ID=MMETSP1338 /ASSEMBLY_ACC=CAM_ASM_000754 /LENGTH=768 /DNA_ID=CAMNT_0043191653 /DNA_START=29 /DNA_END=2335 /DNA_ORIENTATION=-
MKFLFSQILAAAALAAGTDLASGRAQQAQHVAYLITEAETGHPIQNVMDTIKATAEKGLAEGKHEQELMEKFEYQSMKSQKELSENIAENEEAKKEMEDQAAAKKAEKRVVEEDIEVTEKEISHLVAAAAAARENRDEEIRVETLTQTEHNNTIEAMKTAIAALEADKKNITEIGKTELKATKDYAGNAEKALQEKKVSLAALDVASPEVLSLASVRQASEFAVLKLDGLSKEDQDMLNSIAGTEEESDSPLAGRAPAKKQYKFKSGKVLDLLKQMQIQYEDELHAAVMAAEKAEMEYDLAKGASDESIRIARDKLEKQKAHEADVIAKQSELSNSLATTQGELDSDSKTLSDRQMTLKLKKEEFKQRSYLRQREQEALEYGLKILAKVAGVRHEKPKAMLQLGSRDAIIHVHGKDQMLHAIELIRTAAQRIGSGSLGLLANQVEAHMGYTPEIGKNVDQMLEKQVWKLKDEQMKDDEKWHWCNSTVAKTTIENQHKADFIKQTTDQLSSTEATMLELTQDIAQAQKKIDTTKKTVHEEKMLREETRHDHEDAIRDAKDAQKACADAIKIIEKFYKDAKEKSEAAALIQNSYDLAVRGDEYTDDAGFEGGYTGTGTEKPPGEEIITLLQTTAAGFAKMQAESEAQDAQDEQEFEDLMTDCKKEIESRETEVTLKEEERSRLKEKATEYVESIKLADRQKASIERYLADLAKDCVQADFEKRKDDRALEVKSLLESQEQLADAFNYTKAEPNASLAAEPHAMLRGRTAA